MQYLGSSGNTPRERLSGHKSDIINQRINKAIPAHFTATGSKIEDLVFVPIKLFKNSDPAVRLHFENKFVNEHNLIEAGVNRILP